MKSEHNGGAVALAGLAPWLLFWGFVLVGMASADFASQWKDIDWLRPSLAWGSFAATAAGALARLLRGGIPRDAGSPLKLLPVAVILGSVWLLDYVQAVNAFFLPMFRTLLLAVCFVYAGVNGLIGLLYLGLWLFAGALVLGVWYLGYAPLVLEGMSGLALLAAGYLLRGTRSERGTGS